MTRAKLRPDGDLKGLDGRKDETSDEEGHSLRRGSRITSRVAGTDAAKHSRVGGPSVGNEPSRILEDLGCLILEGFEPVQHGVVKQALVGWGLRIDGLVTGKGTGVALDEEQAEVDGCLRGKWLVWKRTC